MTNQTPEILQPPSDFVVVCAGTAAQRMTTALTSWLGQRVELHFAQNGLDALQIVQSLEGRVKLVLFDSLLPGLDGAAVCQRLRQQRLFADLPVILFGEGYRDQERCRRAGCTEYLNNEISEEQLSEALKRVCAEIQMSACLKTTTRCVLLVDDTKEVRMAIKALLRNKPFRVLEAESGAEMDEILENETPDIIILDVMMPGEDGLSVLGRLRSNVETKKIPVLMVSGLGEVDVVSQALELGAVDYLTKPICSQRFQARMRSCLDLIRLSELEAREREHLQTDNKLLQKRVAQQVKSLQDSHRGTIFALAKLAESRDPETGEHLERLQSYCSLLCDALLLSGHYRDILSKEFKENLAAASPLHDIGKVGIPDSILLKPGKLTREEFEVMKSHSNIGADTLIAAADACGNNPLLEMGIEIAKFHHEKWDGSGYPDGLKENQIPLSARILALGDVYDALTSKRVYKDAFSHEKAKAIIVEGRGTHFDPHIVDAFLKVESQFKVVRETLHDRHFEKVAV